MMKTPRNGTAKSARKSAGRQVEGAPKTKPSGDAKVAPAAQARAAVKRAIKPASKATTVKRRSSRGQEQALHEKMRRKGMKLVQIWVPDPQSPYFAAEARRQSKLIVESPYEAEDQAFIDAISEWNT